MEALLTIQSLARGWQFSWTWCNPVKSFYKQVHWFENKINKFRVPDRRERFKSSLELQLLIPCHKVLLTNYLAREVDKLVVFYTRLMLNSPLSPRDQGAGVSIDWCVILPDVERVLKVKYTVHKWTLVGLLERFKIIRLVSCCKGVSRPPPPPHPRNFPNIQLNFQKMYKKITRAEQIFRLHVVLSQKKWASPRLGFYEVIVSLTTLSKLIYVLLKNRNNDKTAHLKQIFVTNLNSTTLQNYKALT